LADLIAELEERARRRYVRWDPAFWRRVLDGPARELAASLRAAGTEDAAAQQMLESYLRLACEGIGLGYFYPPELGEGFFTHAFFRLIPAGLAQLPHEKRAQALADAWNLGENLEHAPAWWRRMFVRLSDGAALGALHALVVRASRDALGEPSARLARRTLHLLIDLGVEDRQFLPGTLHFVAPTVVCVHDRHVAAAAGTLGVWLADPPLVLGPMGCDASVGQSSDRLDLVDDVLNQDPRASDVLNAAANDWRAALTLETSQFLVGIYPA
jgi:hypothetical protein